MTVPIPRSVGRISHEGFRRALSVARRTGSSTALKAQVRQDLASGYVTPGMVERDLAEYFKFKGIPWGKTKSGKKPSLSGSSFMNSVLEMESDIGTGYTSPRGDVNVARGTIAPRLAARRSAAKARPVPGSITPSKRVSVEGPRTYQEHKVDDLFGMLSEPRRRRYM